MKCASCRKNAVTKLEVTLIPLCRDCYCKIIEKRIRKTIRTKKLLKDNEKITLEINGTSASGLLLSFFDEFKKNKQLKIKVRLKNKNASSQIKKFGFEKTKRPYGKTISPVLMDDIVIAFIKEVFENKLKTDKKGYVLEKVEKEQAQKYCKYKKIFYKDEDKKNSASLFIDEIKKRRAFN